MLHADLSRNKEVRERFLREGYAANRVEHAGAVKVLDDDVVASGPESGTAYIVMELLEGESLQDRLERGPPLGELEFLAIAASVLEVLEAAHARGVVHRDLKPENLFLVRASADAGAGGAPSGPRVKVLDFGLARLVQGQAITSYGLALGTPSFMSPEQAAGRIDEIDGRTDLFALAATGFRICTGRRIHEAANPVDLVRKMASLAAPRVRSVRPEVSEACARVIDRALEFRREDRYESAAAMRADVERAVAELEVRGPTQLAIPAPAAPSPQPDVASNPSSSGDQTTIELSATGSPRRLRARGFATCDRGVDPIAAGAIGPPMARAARAGGGHRRHAAGSTIAGALPPGRLRRSSGRRPRSRSSVAPGASAPTSAETAGVGRDRDAAADAMGAPATAASAAALAAPAKSAPALVPTTGAAHRSPPGKVGPGNVHKLPRKHHSAKPHPSQN